MRDEVSIPLFRGPRLDVWIVAVIELGALIFGFGAAIGFLAGIYPKPGSADLLERVFLSGFFALSASFLGLGAIPDLATARVRGGYLRLGRALSIVKARFPGKPGLWTRVG